MKKLFFSVLSIFLLVSLASCALFGEEHKVSFFANGEVIETVQSGVINPPDAPERENYIFDGWFYDQECNKPLGAYDRASEDLTLYAGFRLDYESLVNKIAKTAVRSNVTVYSESYNTGLFGNVTEKASANGSGVIFKQTGDFYYCLTNCHVAEVREGFSNVRFTVTDCFENEYSGVTLVAKDAEYDLAVLKFQKSDAALGTVRFSENAPSIGDTVIAVTQPKGQKNTVTIGEYIRLEEVIIEGNSAGSRIAFPVIYHTAPVDHGSSGGVLLNESLELIGVNFAIATNRENGEFLAGLAVPLDKVNEFLNSVL